LNTTFQDILDSDLCLTIGTNIRFEASLLNVRLRKRIQRGNFVKASIGLCENLTYKNASIGNSLKTLIDIAEGKHSFCQKLIKAEKPVLILGSSLKKRLDSKSISFLVKNLSEYTNICNEDWLGLNFLPLTANSVGKNFIGINTSNKITLSNKKFVYCVGLDSYEILNDIKFKKIPFIVAQTPYSDNFLQQADLILPSTAFTEKEGTFINLEGRVQKTSIALTGPTLARDDSKIVKALFNSSLNNYSFSQIRNSEVIADFEQSKKSFTKPLLLKMSKKKVKIFKTPLKAVLSNFFLSNAITKNSLTMAKCASIFKKNYTNFI
jgi:NADH dehydrogenase/NADH:ubiquinone oxidoreductase subunit G